MLVSFTRCDYPPVQAAYGESGGLGHQTVGLPGTGVYVDLVLAAPCRGQKFLSG